MTCDDQPPVTPRYFHGRPGKPGVFAHGPDHDSFTAGSASLRWRNRRPGIVWGRPPVDILIGHLERKASTHGRDDQFPICSGSPHNMRTRFSCDLYQFVGHEWCLDHLNSDASAPESPLGECPLPRITKLYSSRHHLPGTPADQEVAMPVMRLFLSDRFNLKLASTLRGRRPTLLRATIHNQLPVRCAPSAVE